ncbi:MAG: threonine synthase [Actinomycetia bacterium]|nr:threonine synthase [Actinomycetes bacterium]
MPLDASQLEQNSQNKPRSGQPRLDNRYLDTRGHSSEQLRFSEAILQGLAEGGGLFVPQTIPHLSLAEVLSLATLPYAQQAASLYRHFGVDFPDAQISALMQAAYGSNFDSADIAPLVKVAPQSYVLELWHGPTSAFKDMALQCLPRFFSAAMEKHAAAHPDGGQPTTVASRPQVGHPQVGQPATAAEPTAAGTAAAATSQPLSLILVATSGDTGSAALEGFSNVPGTGIIVFYPHGGVSDIQHRQMATAAGKNVGVVGVEGNFDDCQTAVKAAFGDHDFAQRLAGRNVCLSSANSINWGRLLPQVVYYASAYSRLVAQGALKPGELLEVCVPTGNFGNILAAWYAREAGVPIGRLYCASNENRVLADFINTGIYDISERPFHLTPSPSMDILVSSNLERQLFELNGRNPHTVRTWMESLRDKRRFQVDQATLNSLHATFSADWASSSEAFQAIREVYQQHDYLLDPHTAVAWRVAEKLRPSSSAPMLIVSTAHWAKFGTDVWRALNGQTPGSTLPDEICRLSGAQLNSKIAEKFAAAGGIPPRLANLENLPIRFSSITAGTQEGIEAAVNAWLDSSAG